MKHSSSKQSGYDYQSFHSRGDSYASSKQQQEWRSSGVSRDYKGRVDERAQRQPETYHDSKHRRMGALSKTPERGHSRTVSGHQRYIGEAAAKPEPREWRSRIDSPTEERVQWQSGGTGAFHQDRRSPGESGLAYSKSKIAVSEPQWERAQSPVARDASPGLRTSANGLSCNIFRNGDVFIGQMHNSRIKGLGYFLGTEGLRCEGDWVDGLLTGHGRQVGPAAQRYWGEFSQGMRCGFGLLVFPSLNPNAPEKTVRGVFQDGEPKGVCRSKSGEMETTGYFVQQELHGFGAISSPTFKAVGNFVRGKLQNLGYEQILSSVYVGHFDQGERQGLGLLGDGTPLRFLGYFQRGQKHGFGVENFKNGDSYHGFHQAGLKDGPGRYVHSSDGSIFVGIFQRGLKHGPGRIDDADGGSFLGYWRDGVKNGPGVIRTSEGRTVFGTFRGDKFEPLVVDRLDDGVRDLRDEVDQIERQINRETEALTRAWRGGALEDLKSKERDLEIKIKEVLTRVDNAVLVAKAKCDNLKILVQNSEFERILRDYDRNNNTILGLDPQGTWEDLTVQRPTQENQSLNLASRLAQEGERPGKNTTATAIKRLQVQFDTIFEEELPQRISEPRQGSFQLETGVMQARPTSTTQAHSRNKAAHLCRQTSTTGLDTPLDSTTQSKLLAEAEQRERLIFLEKMEVKKQKEEVLMLVQELQMLRNELRQRPLANGGTAGGDATTWAQKDSINPQFEEAPPEPSPDMRLLQTLQSKIPQSVSFKPGETIGISNLWRGGLSQKIEKKTVRLEGLTDERSCMLYYPGLQEVIIGSSARIYRIKLDLKQCVYEVISVFELEAGERVAQFFDLGGRFGAVILPTARLMLFDLFDEPFANTKLGQEFQFPLGGKILNQQQLSFIESEESGVSPSLIAVVTPDACVGIFSVDSVAKNSNIPKKFFSIPEPKTNRDSKRLETLSAIVNYLELEAWALVRGWTQETQQSEDPGEIEAKPVIQESLLYFNIETEFRCEHDLQKLSPHSRLKITLSSKDGVSELQARHQNSVFGRMGLLRHSALARNTGACSQGLRDLRPLARPARQNGDSCLGASLG